MVFTDLAVTCLIIAESWFFSVEAIFYQQVEAAPGPFLPGPERALIVGSQPCFPPFTLALLIPGR